MAHPAGGAGGLAGEWVEGRGLYPGPPSARGMQRGEADPGSVRHLGAPGIVGGAFGGGMVPPHSPDQVVGNDGSQGGGRLPLGRGCPSLIRPLEVTSIVEAHLSVSPAEGPVDLGVPSSDAREAPSSGVSTEPPARGLYGVLVAPSLHPGRRLGLRGPLGPPRVRPSGRGAVSPCRGAA